MWNEDGLCEAVVNEVHNKQTFFSLFSVFVVVVVAFRLSPYRVAALRVRSESLLVAKDFFSSIFFNILFAAYYLAFFLSAYIQCFSMFCLRLFRLNFVCVCMCCVRLIIFDSSGKVKRRRYEKCIQHKTIEVQSK